MNSSSSESKKQPSGSNTGITEDDVYIYVETSYIEADDKPWFRVQHISRTYQNEMVNKSDIIVLAGSEVITVLKNRFNFEMEEYRQHVILAATKFMSQTIEALTGWVDRSQQVDRDAILEAVTKLTRGQA